MPLTAEEKRERNRVRVNKWRAANRERVRAASTRRWANDPSFREAQRERRAQAKYRDAELKAQRQRRRCAETWPTEILRDIRARCKRSGLPFDLQPSDIAVPDRCPITGEPFVFGHVGHPQSPSVDRRDPALGYICGNVAVISRRANTIKSDCVDPQVFRRLADWLEAGNALTLAQAQGFVEAVAGHLASFPLVEAA